jgi:hypothetical protein
MGRKRKVYGKLYEGPHGKSVRLAISHTRFPPFLRPAPRGKTGSAHAFTAVLKEVAPFVYAFISAELRNPEPKRHAGLKRVIAEWKHASGLRGRPPSRELAAFSIERALRGAWKVWGIKPPFSEGEADSFWRRYVLGHRGALRDFQKALREPQPWPREHRGHWLKYFFGSPGMAATEFNLLTKQQKPWTVITLFEEDSQQSR